MHLYSPGTIVGGLAQVGSFLFHLILITFLYGCPCFIDRETEAHNDDIYFVRSPLWMWQSENSKRVLAFSSYPVMLLLFVVLNWACLSWRALFLLNEIVGSPCLAMTTCEHIYITLFFIDICLTGALSKMTKGISSKVDLTWYLGTQTTGQGYSDLQLKWTTWQPEWAANSL